jgi:two-component system nitrogen regulation response regulator NtrX
VPGLRGLATVPQLASDLRWEAPTLRFRFPGNVRQPRNNVERVMILAAGGPEVIITADMLPQDVGSMVPAMPTSNNGEHIMGLPLREAREVFERDYLIAQISRFSGNISRTAEFVGMERSALHRKLKALGVG